MYQAPEYLIPQPKLVNTICYLKKRHMKFTSRGFEPGTHGLRVADDNTCATKPQLYSKCNSHDVWYELFNYLLIVYHNCGTILME